jgi:hypothetical protein
VVRSGLKPSRWSWSSRSLAHNLIVWARSWLSPDAPRLARYGVLRLVRDVLSMAGFLEMDTPDQIGRIVMNRAAPLARGLAAALTEAPEAGAHRRDSGRDVSSKA